MLRTVEIPVQIRTIAMIPHDVAKQLFLCIVKMICIPFTKKKLQKMLYSSQRWGKKHVLDFFLNRVNKYLLNLKNSLLLDYVLYSEIQETCKNIHCYNLNDV